MRFYIYLSFEKVTSTRLRSLTAYSHVSLNITAKVYESSIDFANGEMTAQQEVILRNRDPETRASPSRS